MNTETNKSSPVYKITGFSDIVASPVFYSILFLALILGLSSIFGFLQNPRKLKKVIDVIHQKVTVSSSKNTFNRNQYSLLASQKDRNVNAEVFETTTVSYLDKSRYSIFSNHLDLVSMNDKDSLVKVSLDYDITSNHFWGAFNDYNHTDPESNGRLIILNPFLLGVPLEANYPVEQGDNKYSMKGLKHYPITL